MYTDPIAKAYHRMLTESMLKNENDESHDRIKSVDSSHNMLHDILATPNPRTQAFKHTVLNRHDIGEKHIDAALNSDSNDSHTRFLAARHKNASSDNIHKAINDENDGVSMEAASHPNATAEHMKTASESKHVLARRIAAKSEKTSPEVLHKLSTDSDSSVRGNILFNKNATSDHITKVLGQDHGIYHDTAHIAAVEHPNATSDHVKMALSTNGYHVHLAAVKSHAATKEQLSDVANNHRMVMVRKEASDQLKSRFPEKE